MGDSIGAQETFGLPLFEDHVSWIPLTPITC